MDAVTQDIGHLPVGCQCSVKEKVETFLIFPFVSEPLFILLTIDLLHDLLYLGWGNFLKELAAHNELFVTIDEIGLGIILLDGVLGQDGKIKKLVELGLVLERQHGAVINLVLFRTTRGGEYQCASQEQQAKDSQDALFCRLFHNDSFLLVDINCICYPSFWN